MIIQKVYFCSFKLGSVKKFKYGIQVSYNFQYLFQLTVLLKLDFNYCNGFGLSWVNNVTVET